MYKRIDLIVDLVDDNKVVCDIGTDHGITALKIYENKHPKKMIATDISENSLNKLRNKLKDLSYDIVTLVTDGIRDLIVYEPNIIIISGMGGYLISKIIDQGFKVAKKADKLILQANNSLSHLRKFLERKGFEIIDDKMVYEDDIYYTLIVAKFKGVEISPYDKDYYYEYGYYLVRDKNPLLKEKLNRDRLNLLRIRNNIKDINTESSDYRMIEIDKEIKIIDEVLRCL